MYIVATLLELAVLGTLVAEIWLGIAVTGWQGEKPYVERKNQPVHFWIVIAIQFGLGVVLPLALMFHW